MNTAVTIVDTISSTILWLAGIGAGLKLALAVAPRFQIAAPKAPPREKPDTEAQASAKPDTPAPPAPAVPVLVEKAS